MGHTVGKDVYRKLGRKIDSLNVRVPWNQTFYLILKELYTHEEAELVANMPGGLTTLPELEKITRIPPAKLGQLIAKLCRKGLVVDLFANDTYYYVPSPLVIGIFEFTMMRVPDDFDIKKISKLFSQYLGDDTFYKANFPKSKKMGIMRALPYEESIANPEDQTSPDFVEVLDYEKATAIVEDADRFSMGICSCRHEKHHTGEKACNVPLETCSSFGYSADYLIRNQLAREVSKSEMLDNVARSKELGLILNADNVQNRIQFICHCCKCCCNVLLGVTRFGYVNAIVTSSFIAQVNQEKCTGCGKCVDPCGVNAIETVPVTAADNTRKKRTAKIDNSLCLGCGVCAGACKFDSLHLVKRKQRVIHPETTFEKAILKCLEKGNLQDQLFTNPKRIDQKILRGILGGFLRLPPVKKALMSQMLRSSFLSLLKKGAHLQNKGWLTKL